MPWGLRRRRAARADAGVAERARFYVRVGGYQLREEVRGVTTLDVAAPARPSETTEAPSPPRRRARSLPFAFDVATVVGVAAVALLLADDWWTAVLVTLALVAPVLLLETAVALAAPRLLERLLGERVVPDRLLVAAAFAAGVGGVIAMGVFLVA